MYAEDVVALSLMAHSGTILVPSCYWRGFPRTIESAQPLGLHRDALQRAKRRSLLCGVWIISQTLRFLPFKQQRPITAIRRPLKRPAKRKAGKASPASIRRNFA